MAQNDIHDQSFSYTKVQASTFLPKCSMMDDGKLPSKASR